ncbi:glutaredoxin family protein [Paraglaciecola arctica]|uniref:Thiol-disulfide isomerase and thioredoxin n=1 Tax=Paraglaciecola arctica BSs20135 TaxID=493475 RepID=K6YGR9_9ALTE|nr:glutaredoxin family protein [Paraglaciecola arctica]GAC17342.1 thiol-disulfide isomerase and thioredoxin [Paraglaciecola arctica BSs20135]
MGLILYTGQGCCLCEQAEALLEKADKSAASILKKVDVRASSDLYHLYGARIPVLYREDNHSELPWPFDSFQLGEFLR